MIVKTLGVMVGSRLNTTLVRTTVPACEGRVNSYKIHALYLKVTSRTKYNKPHNSQKCSGTYLLSFNLPSHLIYQYLQLDSVYNGIYGALGNIYVHMTAD